MNHLRSVNLALLLALTFSTSAGTAREAPRSLRGHASLEARLTFKDMVRFIRADGDLTLVLFTQHAAYYKLERANPDFEIIKRTLQKSMKEKIYLNLTVDAQTLKILSAN